MATSLRRQPYPYKFMLGLSSDCDWSLGDTGPRGVEYVAAQHVWRFRQLGLDVSSTFFFVDDNTPMTSTSNAHIPDYWIRWAYPQPFSKIPGDVWDTPNSAQLDLIDKYIRCGWLDSLHSFGGFHFLTLLGYSATNGDRDWFVEYMDCWRERGWGRWVNSWVDHKNNARNFYGPGDPPVDSQNFVDFAPGYRLDYRGLTSRTGGAQGDVSDDPWYHTDLVIGRDAIRYVWNGEYSYVDASDIAIYGADVMEELHPRYKSANITRQELIYPVTLRDGRKVWGFDRALHYMYDDNGMDTQLAWVSTPTHWQKALAEGGFVLLYGHFAYPPFNNDFVETGHTDPAWFAERQQAGDVLIARPSRMLDYALARDHVQWFEHEGDIHITHIEDECFGDFVPEVEQLRGVTWLTDNQDARLILNGAPIDDSELSVAYDAEAQQWAIGVAWYPADDTNYTQLSRQEVITLLGEPSAPEYQEVLSFDLAEAYLPNNECAGVVAVGAALLGDVRAVYAARGSAAVDTSATADVTTCAAWDLAEAYLTRSTSYFYNAFVAGRS